MSLQIRGPLATIRRLDETEANLARYETWRGKQTGPQADGPTGADEMRSQMRQRVVLWGVVAGAGVVSVLRGAARRAEGLLAARRGQRSSAGGGGRLLGSGARG